MAHHKVPGLSVAAIDGGKVVDTAAFGLADVSTGAPVAPDTLFQACSMSKPAMALAVVMAAERGALDLDAPVNSLLKSWQLPSSDAFSADDVTLRRLLSHSAGLSVPGFKGYEAGAALPTTVQILDGEEPANSDPVRLIYRPGSEERYSGGGSTLAQLVLEDLWGRPAAAIFDETCLAPLGMTSSTFRQALPADLEARTATGHDQDGLPVPGRRHIYPETAAAGLWTTAADYARFLIGIQDALAGRSSLLSQEWAQRFITPQPNSAMGLGPEITGTGDSRLFGHSGGNRGFRCDSRAYVKHGKGAVVLVNGEGALNQGWMLTRELMGAIARAYDWPDFVRPPRAPVRLSRAEMEVVTGRYVTDTMSTTVAIEDGALISDSTLFGRRELLPLSPTSFFSAESSYDIRFEPEAMIAHDGPTVVLRLTRADT
jgi:CubicO group peptidase (beta-lactamase class C family)